MKKRHSSNWGGRRPGAGRKPKGDRALVSHKARPRFSGRAAVHVVLRFDPRINLDSRRVRDAIEAALEEGRDRLGFHVVETRSSKDQLHFLAEVEGTLSLSRGMQGLSIRIAKGINRELRTHGKLFADHFEAFVLRSRGEVAAVRAHGRRWSLAEEASAPARLAVLRHLGAAG
jgi:REP element-mobilizing transposase RayT